VRRSLIIVVFMALASFIAMPVVADIIPPDWEAGYGDNSQELYDTKISSTINIGFNFEFYGDTYTQVAITPNGYIGFVGPDGGVTNADYADEAGGWPTYSWNERYTRLVAPIWSDFNPSGSYYVWDLETYYDFRGTAGSRRFIVTWEDTPDANGDTNTFQLQLHEDGDMIQMSYLSFPFEPSDTYQNPIGVNYGDGVEYTSFEYDGVDNGIGPTGSLEGHSLYFTYNAGSGKYDMESQYAPEPGTAMLMLAGLAAGWLVRRRQKT
jgi:hypothetical protein